MSQLLDTMLSQMPPTIDTTVGGFAYDILSAVAASIDGVTADIAAVIDRIMPDSAIGDDLDRIANSYGISRTAAVFAHGDVTFSGSVGASVPIGSRVASASAEYLTDNAVTVGSGGTVTVGVVAITAGTDGNASVGDVTVIPSPIAGISAVTNASAISGGVPSENDGSLRKRLLMKLSATNMSGTAANYVSWASSVAGIGNVRVIPLWNGVGTVKVVISSSDGSVASAEQISAVTSEIDRYKPIGATVTVVSAIAVPITVTVSLSTGIGYDLGGLTASVDGYIRQVAKDGGNVLYSRVGAAILSAAGVVDYAALSVNSGTSNITIGNTEIPVLQGVTVL